MMYRNPAVLAAAKDMACQYCDREDGTTVMAHSNELRHGKGKGLKAHDVFVAALCSTCHTFVDQSSAPIEIRTGVWRLAHDRTIPLVAHLISAEGWELLAEDTP